MPAALAPSPWPVLPTPIDTQGSNARADGGVAAAPGPEIAVPGTDSCAYTTACWPGMTTRVGAASTRWSAGCAGSVASASWVKLDGSAAAVMSAIGWVHAAAEP